MVEQTSPTVGRVRAYFAPVTRGANGSTTQTVIFDPAKLEAFALDAPAAPWLDLGWIHGFTRVSGSKVEPVRTGAPATTQQQVRTVTEAAVEFAFETWGKLQLALACGSQSLNVLAADEDGTPAWSGGAGQVAVDLLNGSTATVLQVGVAAAMSFRAGQTVVVDVDYAGQTGFVGSGASGAFLRAAVTDVDFIRRASLNVARIADVANGALTLASPLPAGIPDSAMKASRVVGFCDREGGTYFAEWSGLFVAEGQQGECLMWCYPRLQAFQTATEDMTELVRGYRQARLGGAFRALPVTDPLDGEQVVCFRSYLLSA